MCGCKVKKNKKWARNVKTEKQEKHTRKGVEWGGGDGQVGRDMVGGKGGRN